MEVVVPSPAESAVWMAACFTNWTPDSLIGSFNLIFFATVTPSLVDLIGSLALEITTFLPFGPKVETTASAKVSIPATNFSRASAPNSIILTYTFI